MIWSSLFTIGNFLYGRTGYALGLLVVVIASGLVLLSVVRTLWSDTGTQTPPASRAEGSTARGVK